MFYTLNKRTMTCNLISVGLLIIMLVLQFLPFWSYASVNLEGNPTEGDVSIQQYVWFRQDFKNNGMDKWFVSVIEGSKKDISEIKGLDVDEANALVTGPALGFAFALLGIALCFFKNDKKYPAIFAAVCGFSNLYGYLTQPILQLNPIWYAHLALAILIVVSAALTFILGMKENA